jgi:hypothetical protein
LDAAVTGDPADAAAPATQQKAARGLPGTDTMRVRMDAIKKTMNIAGGAIGGVGKVFDEFMHGNNTIENSLSVVLFAFLYLYGWTTGLERSSSACASTNECSATAILWTLAFSLAEGWIILVVLVLVLLIVDKLVISTLFRSNDMDRITPPSLTSVSVGMRIAFAWLTNGPLIMSIIIAFVVTAIFAFCYAKWTQLRNMRLPAKQTELHRKLFVRNLYIFNLTTMALLLVTQLSLDAWWKSPGRGTT